MKSYINGFCDLFNKGQFTHKEIEKCVKGLTEEYKTSSSIIQKNILNIIELYQDVCQKNNATQINIMLISLLLYLNPTYEYAKKMIKVITETNLILSIKMFLYWQIVRVDFVEKLAFSPLVLRSIYEKCFNEHRKELNIKTEYCNKSQRDKKTVVVLICQLLEWPHSPTRLALAYIRALCNKGYNVVLINTASLPLRCETLFVNPSLATHIPERDGWIKVQYKEIFFSYYQSKGSLHDLIEMKKIFSIITDLKPYFIFNIGGSNIVADLCHQYSDVVNISLSQELAIAVGGIHLVSSKTEGAVAIKSKQKCITGGIIYEPLEQVMKFTRTEFGIKEDVFLIVIVGNRLDEEITNEYIHFLTKAMKKCPRLHYVFVGEFQRFEELLAEYEEFKARFSSVGFQDDLIAFYEICNIYVSTPGRGGGYAAIDAMIKGLPVITLAKGDVALVSKNKWAVDSYEKMVRLIVDFYNNENEYNKARIQAEDIGRYWSSGQSIVDILKQVEIVCGKGPYINKVKSWEVEL